MVPRETVKFCFPSSPRTLRKTKLMQFPEGPYIRCFVIYLDFPFNNHSKTKKQTTERATTAELYPSRDTFCI